MLQVQPSPTQHTIGSLVRVHSLFRGRKRFEAQFCRGEKWGSGGVWRTAYGDGCGCDQETKQAKMVLVWLLRPSAQPTDTAVWMGGEWAPNHILVGRRQDASANHVTITHATRQRVDTNPAL